MHGEMYGNVQRKVAILAKPKGCKRLQHSILVVMVLTIPSDTRKSVA